MPAESAAKSLALRDAKQALRGRMQAVRDALDETARARLSQAIAARIAALPAFVAARTVLLTLPYRSEWDTRPLARAVIAAHRRLVLPRVDRAERVLALHAIADLERDVEPGYLGIPEPRASCDVVAPHGVDFVVVPGVAFDGQGRRLGYGGGFYDRLLPQLRADVTLVAGAFDEQVVDAVPSASHDACVPLVLTPTRMLATGAR
jgi:5-formyltetrahydrofolate cyclo-ligase